VKGLYINIPKEYIETLQNKSKRDKARAFMEYYFDLEKEALNSLRFYSKGWKVALGTASNWIKEFEYQIEKYHTFHILKNQQGANSVLKQSEQKLNKSRTKTEHCTQLQKVDNIEARKELLNKELNTSCTKTEQKLNKDKNINIIKRESKQTSGAKKLSKYTTATQQEFWELKQEDEIKRDMRTAKLENLSQANKENQILDLDFS